MESFAVQNRNCKLQNAKMLISNWQFAFSNLQLPGLWTTHQSSQESDTVSDILQALIARFSFDHDPAVIIILLQLADIAHPVDVTVAYGDLLGGPVGANSPCIVGVGVNQSTGQGGQAGKHIKPVHEQVGRIKVNPQSPGVQTFHHLGKGRSWLDPGLARQYHANPVSVSTYGLQRADKTRPAVF